MESRLMRNRVPISLITPYYKVTGEVSVTAAGLVGLVNDINDSYIELENAVLVRIHRPQEVVAQFPVWNTVKARIVAVLLESKGDLGRLSVARAGYTRQIAYRVWAAVQGFELFGAIESPGKFDFSAELFQGSRQFSPLFNATVIPVFFPQLVTRSPALLFNRTMVEGMGVLSELAGGVMGEEKKPTPTGGLSGGSRGGTGQIGGGGRSTGSLGGEGRSTGPLGGGGRSTGSLGGGGRSTGSLGGGGGSGGSYNPGG